ncbi:MAG: TRAP transporter small permease [Deltaproteobacteria bacterium]|nr:TRAP transporter small permease [Deltaproteobacteria bacterium]
MNNVNGMGTHSSQHNSLTAALIRASAAINRATEYGIAIMMAAMTIIITIQVFYRYALNDPLSWTEEIARYLMIWICFLGSAMALKYGEHISVSFIQERFAPRIRQVIGFCIGIAVLAFFILATWEGIVITIQVSEQQAPATWISMAWAYSCIPVGCFIMMFHTLVELITLRGMPLTAASACERPL